ncbi:putative Cytochrome c oxidase assembly protein COX19 [Hypsibius exemplaris]|uniref:Cytochrome c oxidase assembly protein COX19 n=1 Tax=Hypsibius exemplaris TaxID=2072580 RepID=A0A1W0XBM6_HYPEX|nr:putative Cytochrome c oxidase assembly protein COX19 [Hypsibius exemplaris]
MAQSLYGSKVFKPKPPDKGSFPLDHEGECKQPMEVYMKCLYDHKYNNTECRLEAKDYLDCRMQKELMAKADWSKLGYKDLDERRTSEKEHPKPS